MVDWLQNAVVGLKKALPKRTVRYYRGSDWVEMEDVTVASTNVGYETGEGVRMNSKVRDYLIVPESLIINSIKVEPAEGDQIVDTNDGSTQTYEVMSLGGDMAWRYTDRYHTMLRVHTRDVIEVAL